MNRIRILNAEPNAYSAEARRLLATVGNVEEQDLDHDGLMERIDEVDVLIVRLRFQIDRGVIDAATRLKAIVTATTGLDHVDVDYAKARGIDVLSLRGETAFLRSVAATAEHTWALLLSLVRNIPAAFASVCRGGWDRDSLRGHDLRGKRLGIVGFGRIGEAVARYAHAFGMEVHAVDPNLRSLPSGVHRHDDLEGVLRLADVLTLHVPLDDQTQGLIGAKELSLLPRGAVLLNTSRGDVIDTKALLDALRAGGVAGAALDVLPGERCSHPSRQALLQYAGSHSNLLITPHIGGATVESMAKTEKFMAQKLVLWNESVLSRQTIDSSEARGNQLLTNDRTC